MILFVLSTIFALVLRFWGSPVVLDLYVYHPGLCTSEKCLGIGGVNRISFALFVFFFIHAVLLRFVAACARFDASSWWTKLFGFVVLLILAWLLPNSFYAVYMQFARVISAFFLLFQLILLIDFAYTWNASWTSDEKPWQKGVIVASVLLFAASLTAFVLHLIYFGTAVGVGACHTQKFFIAFTLVLTFLMTGISVSNIIKDGGGLLPAAVVTLYSYWLLFTALTSDPSECNNVSSRSKEIAPLIIGLLLTTASVTYASWSLATNANLFSHDAPVQARDEEKAAAKEEEEEEAEEPVDSVASQEQAQRSARFHALMASASMYLCMLMSAWGSQSSAEGGAHMDLSTTNMWIKIVTQWICILLYTWTLLAPVICTNRTFA